jgi:hypothetical protein
VFLILCLKIQQAFVERRHTFLSGSEWIEVPFKDRPKSMFQKLLDVAATVPNIIADGYQMLQGAMEGTATIDPTVMLMTLLGLIDRCWKVDLQLHNFYQTLEEDTLGPVYWPELSTEIEGIDSEELGKVFPVTFKYLDMRTAHMCIFFWATSAILWSGMAYAYKLLLGLQAATSIRIDALPDDIKAVFNIAQPPPLGHRTEVAILARNICQSLEFCLADEFRGVGARAAVFPLKVAIETLHDAPGCERELHWAEAAMARISQNGVRIMEHLPVPLTDHSCLPG